MRPNLRWDRYRGLDPGEIPAYTTDEAAHHLRLPENTIRAWAFGRHFPRRGRNDGWAPPLICTPDPDRRLLSFLNVLELHALRGLRREHEVQMRSIREALEFAKEKFPFPHPLIDGVMSTDGVDMFIEHYGELINLSRHGQLAMRAVLEAHLKRIERYERGYRFFPFLRRPSEPAKDANVIPEEQPRLIAMDPHVAFGRPVLADYRIPTAEINERFTAGDSIAEIARDYDCPPSAIEEAIRWEKVA